MASKTAMQKAAVMVIDRRATIHSVLMKLGPMDQPTLHANLLKIDEDVQVKRVRKILYQLRKAGKVAKRDDGTWAAS